MALQPSAEQPPATGAPGTFGQPRAVDPRARFQIPVIPATFFADDLNIKSPGSATLPSKPRGNERQRRALNSARAYLPSCDYRAPPFIIFLQMLPIRA